MVGLIVMVGCADSTTATTMGGTIKVGLLHSLSRTMAISEVSEPTEGLQPSIVEEMIQRLHSERGLSILLAEQYFEFAMRVAGRYVVLDAGEVVAPGRHEVARGQCRAQRAGRDLGRVSITALPFQSQGG